MIAVSKADSDYYLRMSLESIGNILLRRDFSEVTCVSPCIGITEWVAQIGDKLLTVGWDWIRLDDGAIVQLHPRTMFSNLMLVDDYGLDRGAQLTEAALLRVADRNAWQSAGATACDQLRPRLLGEL